VTARRKPARVDHARVPSAADGTRFRAGLYDIVHSLHLRARIQPFARKASTRCAGRPFPGRYRLAEHLAAQGDFDRALPFLRKAIAITEKAEGADHPDVAGRMMALARCYCRLGRDAEGEAILKQALQLLEKPRPQIPFQIFDVLEYYADLLRGTGREAQAKQVDARLRALQKKLAQPNPEP
jgi:tetratricopeptide (TPR) repeat protein